MVERKWPSRLPEYNITRPIMKVHRCLGPVISSSDQFSDAYLFLALAFLCLSDGFMLHSLIKQSEVVMLELVLEPTKEGPSIG